jgi:mannobiose 2-epimerase
MPLRPPAIRPAARTRALLWLALLSLLLPFGASPTAAQSSDAQLSAEQADRFVEQAERWRRQLSEQMMPFWYDTALDPVGGGYLLPEAGTSNRLLASQARLMWSFARAHRLGLRDPGGRDYLAAASQGYRFLRAHFRDPLNGGYYWMTSRDGRPLDQRKFLHGQACMLHGLVEYYRASGDVAALQDAIDLHHTIMERAHDPVNGGWGEHFDVDWRPMVETETVETGPTGRVSRRLPASRPMVDPHITGGIGVAGTKSAEAHLQLMAALTELHRITRAPGAPAAAAEVKVEPALAEALDVNLTHFFPPDPGAAYPYRQPDWQRPLGAKFREINYGHNVAFAWLMLEAQAALGRDPLWQRFDALLQHSLKHGFDHERGGLYAVGFGARPALVTEKIWWGQAEMLAALTTSVRHRAAPEHVEALEQLLSFLTRHQIDPQDGVWFDAVKADGSPWRPAKAHGRKTSFHELRAMARFIEAFGAS